MTTVHYVLSNLSSEKVLATKFDDSAEPLTEYTMLREELSRFVASHESTHPRWVWSTTSQWYPQLLEDGIRIERCTDLYLCHVILKHSSFTSATGFVTSNDDVWMHPIPERTDSAGTLFDLDSEPFDHEYNAVQEFQRQFRAIADSHDSGRLRLLTAAESAGALVATEIRCAGLPWRTDVHDGLLREQLGPRVPHGQRPQKMEELAQHIRSALEAPGLNPDSQAELLKALRTNGLVVSSTRAWELRELDHPAIPRILEYKKLARLASANGWAWMDTWITEGRFRPDYVPGGVVTGRWATRGGGALQLPKQVRGAVTADRGWKLVVADAAQLEPRILAALSGDSAMAAAGRGHDLYDGVVASGVVQTRQQAKIAMLGAMYGATSGDSARLVPQLAKAYPRALALVEDAARTGERGGAVTSWLGRSSPRPDEAWDSTQREATEPSANPLQMKLARSQSRDWGRFTRNFIVQSSAAEWALCWMAELRKSLVLLRSQTGEPGRASAPFDRAPHLVYFLHDEVIVHTPEAVADRAAEEVRVAAKRAGELLFGDFPVDFALSLNIVDNYAQAK